MLEVNETSSENKSLPGDMVEALDNIMLQKTEYLIMFAKIFLPEYQPMGFAGIL